METTNRMVVANGRGMGDREWISVSVLKDEKGLEMHSDDSYTTV